MNPSLGWTGAAERLRNLVTEARRGLVERDVLVELLVLGAVAGEHVLVIGPPGTAKSEAVRRFARGARGAYFEYLLGKFTEPAELFGPIDLRGLREGRVQTDTTGMLPEAEIAFLDEVFLGSTAILNTLLAILNERTFRRGHTTQKCPLVLCVGASNALPEDESLAAFADRFLLRIFVEPVADAHIEELLGAAWQLRREASAAGTNTNTNTNTNADAPAPASTSDIRTLGAAANTLDVRAVAAELAEAVRLLRRAGVLLSDRRIAKCQALVAAAAALSGRTTPTAADLWPIIYAVPTKAGQDAARAALGEMLAAAESRALLAAAEDASAGPRARMLRIERLGREVLAAAPTGSEAGPATRRAWQLRLEGVAREIDAGFLPTASPPEIRALRERIVAEIESATRRPSVPATTTTDDAGAAAKAAIDAPPNTEPSP